MSVTVESINGLPRTVIWHQEGYKTTLGRKFIVLRDGGLGIFADADHVTHIATALHPLPLKPDVKNVKLLYLYAAHGLIAHGRAQEHVEEWDYPGQPTPRRLVRKEDVDREWEFEGIESLNLGYRGELLGIKITHAVNERGESLDIAVRDYGAGL